MSVRQQALHALNNIEHEAAALLASIHSERIDGVYQAPTAATVRDYQARAVSIRISLDNLDHHLRNLT